MPSIGTSWARWPASANGRCPTFCRRRASSPGALDTVKVTLARGRASVDFLHDAAGRQGCLSADDPGVGLDILSIDHVILEQA